MPMPRVKGSITNGTNIDRDPTDFYATPVPFTLAMLDRVNIPDPCWDPGAGDGAIIDALKCHGLKACGTDIVPRRDDIREHDFLAQAPDQEFRSIIMNPPFKLMVEFIVRALDLTDTVACVMPISGLNSSKRYQAIWQPHPPSRILLSGRYQHIRTARGVVPSQFSHVWVVWQPGRERTEFEWLPDVVYKD